MKLRARLVVATAAAVVPLVVVLIWLDARARHAAAEETLVDLTLRTMLEPGEREACEAAPAQWSGRSRPPPDELRGPRVRAGRPHGAPPVLVAYDAQLHAADPEAPPLDDELADGIARGDVATIGATWPGSAVEVLVRTPWASGPCAFVYAAGTTEPGWIGAILPAGRLWMVPMAVVLAAVLLAMGPAVRRMRRLTEAVRRSAAAGFTGDVPADGARDEIAELGRAFDAASREVRAQLAERDRRERALRDFLANTTHDVMIPLTVLQQHLATLRERGDDATVVAAMDEAHYMASMIHNLAIAARLDAGEPELHRAPVELGALIARVVARHRPIARELHVELDSAAPEPVATDADVTLLEQAVSNVVYNAIRHNRAGGHVAVILEPQDAGRRFRVRVVDDGPGVPADQLARLAERGYRGDAARTRSPGGQGLGLHIAWRVAELHGLALHFAASDHGGLEVTLEGPSI